jgi:hypothetical protein
MRVLDLFSLECPEWGVGEIARCLELPKSTTSELMARACFQSYSQRTTAAMVSIAL